MLAVGAGVVTAIEAVKSASGISCANLTEWNALTLQLDPLPSSNSAASASGGDDGGGDEATMATKRLVDGSYNADYVHIQAGSACVEVGARVVAGQQLCLSGSVGFSPEPHLHLELHHAHDPMGPSLPFAFITTATEVARAADGGEVAAFTPTAGRWWDSTGEVVQ